MIAHYNYAKGRCDAMPKMPTLRFDGQGWTWLARIDTDLYAWVTLGIEASRAMPDAPEMLRKLTAVHEIRGAYVTWRRVVPCAAAGMYCLGDAGVVLDPASAHGVLRALMSGIMAGELIAAASRGAISREDSAARYDRWLGDWFEHDKRLLLEMYLKMGCEMCVQRVGV